MKEKRKIQKGFSTGDVYLVVMIPNKGRLQRRPDFLRRHPLLPPRATVVKTMCTGSLALVREDQTQVSGMEGLSREHGLPRIQYIPDQLDE
jgi:hypothetical protein